MIAAIWLPAAGEFAPAAFEARLPIAHRLAVHLEHIAQLDEAILLGGLTRIRSDRSVRDGSSSIVSVSRDVLTTVWRVGFFGDDL